MIPLKIKHVLSWMSGPCVHEMIYFDFDRGSNENKTIRDDAMRKTEADIECVNQCQPRKSERRRINQAKDQALGYVMIFDDDISQPATQQYSSFCFCSLLVRRQAPENCIISKNKWVIMACDEMAMM
jgi:hypothetical protein